MRKHISFHDCLRSLRGASSKAKQAALLIAVASPEGATETILEGTDCFTFLRICSLHHRRQDRWSGATYQRQSFDRCVRATKETRRPHSGSASPCAVSDSAHRGLHQYAFRRAHLRPTPPRTFQGAGNDTKPDISNLRRIFYDFHQFTIHVFDSIGAQSGMRIIFSSWGWLSFILHGSNRFATQVVTP